MMQKRSMVWASIAILISLALAGCGTIVSQGASREIFEAKNEEGEYDRDDSCCILTPHVYSGVVTDYTMLTFPFSCPCTGESGLAGLAFWPLIATLAIIDMPLSAAADTVILPYTIPRQIKYGYIDEKCHVCR